MVNLITEDTKITCHRCGKTELAIAWDAFTESKCLDREMRRHYIHITDSKVFRKSGKVYKYSYCCPNCGRFVRVNDFKYEENA